MKPESLSAMASSGKYLEANLFEGNQEFIVEARALGVCLEGVIFLKSSRFSRCFSFPGSGCGEPFGNGAMLCAELPSTELPQACQGLWCCRSKPSAAAGVWAALPCSWGPLHCAGCKAFVTFAWVLNCEL